MNRLTLMPPATASWRDGGARRAGVARLACGRPPSVVISCRCSGTRQVPVGLDLEREREHALAHRHLEVEAGGDGLPQQAHIALLDVAPILAQVHGDAVGAAELSQGRSGDGIGFAPAPGLAHGGDMVDVHAPRRIMSSSPAATAATAAWASDGRPGRACFNTVFMDRVNTSGDRARRRSAAARRSAPAPRGGIAPSARHGGDGAAMTIRLASTCASTTLPRMAHQPPPTQGQMRETLRADLAAPSRLRAACACARSIDSPCGRVVVALKRGGYAAAAWSTGHRTTTSAPPRARVVRNAATRRARLGRGRGRVCACSRAGSPSTGGLEERLARWLGAEDALLTTTGFQANLAAIVALVAEPESVVILDRLCHASTYDGARLCAGTLQRFAHNDLADLERQLDRSAEKRRPGAPGVRRERVLDGWRRGAAGWDPGRLPPPRRAAAGRRGARARRLRPGRARPVRRARHRTRPARGHLLQGARRAGRLHLRRCRAGRAVRQSRAQLHLLHRPGARRGGRRARHPRPPAGPPRPRRAAAGERRAPARGDHRAGLDGGSRTLAHRAG